MYNVQRMFLAEWRTDTSDTARDWWSLTSLGFGSNLVLQVPAAGHTSSAARSLKGKKQPNTAPSQWFSKPKFQIRKFKKTTLVFTLFKYLKYSYIVTVTIQFSELIVSYLCIHIYALSSHHQLKSSDFGLNFYSLFLIHDFWKCFCIPILFAFRFSELFDNNRSNTTVSACKISEASIILF